MRLLRLLPLCLCLSALVGCLADAEHTNPLDPLSDAYRDAGGLSGTVIDRDFDAVPGVAVRLRPLTGDTTAVHIGETNAQGFFSFPTIPSGPYAVRFEKEGFVSHTDTVAIMLRQLTQISEVRLNALPVVASAALRTVHISRWWPEDDAYFVDIVLHAVDPDERPGLDSVRILIPDASIELELAPALQPGTFVATVPAESLATGSVHMILGRTTLARLRDREGNAVVYAILGPIRVIDQTPAAIRPQQSEEIQDPRPTLEWAQLDLPYEISYRVEVVRDEVNADVLVQEHEGISSDSTQFRLPDALAAGTYYWTVAVVDAFGNRSRSKEAGFRVN